MLGKIRFLNYSKEIATAAVILEESRSCICVHISACILLPGFDRKPYTDWQADYMKIHSISGLTKVDSINFATMCYKLLAFIVIAWTQTLGSSIFNTYHKKKGWDINICIWTMKDVLTQNKYTYNLICTE